MRMRVILIVAGVAAAGVVLWLLTRKRAMAAGAGGTAPNVLLGPGAGVGVTAAGAATPTRRPETLTPLERAQLAQNEALNKGLATFGGSLEQLTSQELGALMGALNMPTLGGSRDYVEAPAQPENPEWWKSYTPPPPEAAPPEPTMWVPDGCGPPCYCDPWCTG